MTNLKDVPLDLVQEAATALGLYVEVRRKEKLLRERAHLQRELRDTQANLVEIQALFAGMEPLAEGEDHA